jgi:8-oxo-dGTP diphosphatase
MPSNEATGEQLEPSVWLNSLPSKRLAAQVILRNEDGHIMLVKPVYREGWLLPGGIVEEGESPMAGAQRELMEELGIDLTHRQLKLIGIDYSGPWGDFKDVLHVIFDGVVVRPADESRMTMDLAELSAYRFFSMAELLADQAGFIGRRVANILESSQSGSTYLEWGKELV